MQFTIKAIFISFSFLLSLSTFSQVRTYAPRDASSSRSVVNSHRGTGEYKLRSKKVYVGFYAYKSFQPKDTKSLKREHGTAVGKYACENDKSNIKSVTLNLGRYKSFYVSLKEKNDCVRELYRVDLYSAKYNRHIIVYLTKKFKDNQNKEFTLLEHSKDRGIFLRAIFNQSDLTANPEIHSVTKIKRNYLMYFLPYAASNEPAEAPYYKMAKSEHFVAVLDRGVAALYKRLEMIKSAKKSIELLTYIYSPHDSAGRLISQALAQKARDGVKVRLIIDRNPFGFEMKKKYTSALIEAGVEVKLHNNNFWKINPWQVRNHQKMLIIDGKQMITGGRNTAAAYFGLNPERNYVDRDIWIFGKIVNNAVNSFDVFWINKILDAPKFYKKWDRDFLVRSKSDQTALDKVNSLGKQQIENDTPVVKVNSAAFIGDKPGSNDDYTRVVSHFIYNLLRKNQNEEVLLEAPYFLMLREGKDVLDGLLEKGVPMSVLTNSRYSISTSHIPMAYILEKLNETNVQNGVSVFGYSGLPLPDEKIIAELKERTPTELHGKSMIIGDSVFVGSYNLDPRSKYFNVEMGIYFENEPELAKIMLYSYTRILNNSMKMKADGTYQDSYIFEEIQRRRSKFVDKRAWLSFKSVMMDLLARKLL